MSKLLFLVGAGAAAAIAFSNKDDETPTPPPPQYYPPYPPYYPPPTQGRNSPPGGQSRVGSPPFSTQVPRTLVPSEQLKVDKFAREPGQPQIQAKEAPVTFAPGVALDFSKGSTNGVSNATVQAVNQIRGKGMRVWLTSALHREIRVRRNHDMFAMMAPTAEAARFDQVPDRRLILIDTWESYRFFARILTSVIFALSSDNPAVKSSADLFVQWFNYHDWMLDPTATVRDEILASLRRVSGRIDERLWPEGADGAAGNWPDIQPRLQQLRSMPRITDFDRATAVVDSHDGLTLMLEYAIAQYMSMSMCMAILQHDAYAQNVAGTVAGGLMEAFAGGVNAAGIASRGANRDAEAESLGAVFTAIVTAAVTIAAGLTKALIGVGNEAGTWDSMRDKRTAIADQVTDILRVDFRGRSISDFSGYRLGLLVLSRKPIDDVKEQLWQYYFFSTEGRINVGPQFPCYYLGLDFDLTWSIACMDHGLVVLHPRVNDQKLPFAFSTLIINQSVFRSNPRALDMDVWPEPGDDVPPSYRPPSCWPHGPEKGWKGGLQP